jgi:hypothetical protein
MPDYEYKTLQKKFPYLRTFPAHFHLRLDTHPTRCTWFEIYLYAEVDEKHIQSHMAEFKAGGILNQQATFGFQLGQFSSKPRYRLFSSRDEGQIHDAIVARVPGLKRRPYYENGLSTRKLEHSIDLAALQAFLKKHGFKKAGPRISQSFPDYQTAYDFALAIPWEQAGPLIRKRVGPKG